jgi:Flp pilus assembly protein TadD
MANYYLKYPAKKGGLYSIDCWFERAMTFRPEDGVVRVVYAIFLARKGDNEAALSRYKEALALQPDSPETHYNIGLETKVPR